jgi:hypothetical protein
VGVTLPGLVFRVPKGRIAKSQTADREIDDVMTFPR